MSINDMNEWKLMFAFDLLALIMALNVLHGEIKDKGRNETLVLAWKVI
jgi:hypothetical protein